jgi:hypothetical protein
MRSREAVFQPSASPSGFYSDRAHHVGMDAAQEAVGAWLVELEGKAVVGIQGTGAEADPASAARDRIRPAVTGA